MAVAGSDIRFAAKNPAPEFLRMGEPGQERELEVELKVLADVGGWLPLLGNQPFLGNHHFS